MRSPFQYQLDFRFQSTHSLYFVSASMKSILKRASKNFFPYTFLALSLYLFGMIGNTLKIINNLQDDLDFWFVLGLPVNA